MCGVVFLEGAWSWFEKLLYVLGFCGKAAVNKGYDTCYDLDARVTELNSSETPRADASYACIVDAGFENPTEDRKRIEEGKSIVMRCGRKIAEEREYGRTTKKRT